FFKLRNMKKELELVEEINNHKQYSTLELRSEETKKNKRIDRILEITNSMIHKGLVNNYLINHKFINKVSLEKKVFIVLFHLFLKSNEIIQLINLIKLYPGKRTELLKYNMNEFSYTKDINYNKIIYDEVYKYISNYLAVNYNLDEYYSLLGCSKPECVAVFTLLKEFNIESMFNICKLHFICSLDEIYSVYNKFKRLSRKKRKQ
ncbi:hypothetical protein H311_04858, partial [Anncaliia algerae PRA109]